MPVKISTLCAALFCKGFCLQPQPHPHGLFTKPPIWAFNRVLLFFDPMQCCSQLGASVGGVQKDRLQQQTHIEQKKKRDLTGSQNVRCMAEQENSPPTPPGPS
jgi:hypothetical protein